MTNYPLLTETSLTADWAVYQPCWLPRIWTTRVSHESEQYLTNPRPRLLHQSWGSNMLTHPLWWFSCPQASCPVTMPFFASLMAFDTRSFPILWFISVFSGFSRCCVSGMKLSVLLIWSCLGMSWSSSSVLSWSFSWYFLTSSAILFEFLSYCGGCELGILSHGMTSCGFLSLCMADHIPPGLSPWHAICVCEMLVISHCYHV